MPYRACMVLHSTKHILNGFNQNGILNTSTRLFEKLLYSPLLLLSSVMAIVLPSTIICPSFPRFTFIFAFRLELSELVGRLFSECTLDDDLGGLCVQGQTGFNRVMLLLVYALITKAFFTVVSMSLNVFQQGSTRIISYLIRFRVVFLSLPWR